MGNKDLAKPGFEPCLTNEGKDKGELGTFQQQLFIYSKRGKACGTTKVYWVCNAGKEERGVGGCDNYTSNLLKQTQCRLDARLIRVTTIRIFYRLT